MKRNIFCNRPLPGQSNKDFTKKAFDRTSDSNDGKDVSLGGTMDASGELGRRPREEGHFSEMSVVVVVFAVGSVKEEEEEEEERH